ncbi:glycosyltransferase [Sagittula salina]|uniref:Glycosyltransferase n=1 Tax=Sagittula salina TaxID=2820268 RepID=A0A940MV18_9RHOB|nr:glycosyltransferase [Sagittula salina]MBP0484482.1 glycosyltransferase [Sagittula salina]
MRLSALLPARVHDLRARLEQKMGGFRGYVDGIAGQELMGWVQATADPRLRPRVGVFVQGARICEVSANIYRQDLEAAGVGDGRHGFAVPLSEEIMRLARANGGTVELRVLMGGGHDAHLGHHRLCETDATGRVLPGSALRKRLYAGLDLMSRLSEAPPAPAIVPRPLGRHAAKLFGAHNYLDPGRPLPAPMCAYTEFVRYRNRVDRSFDPNRTPKDIAHFHKFYLGAYAPMRRGLRVPLSRDAIAWANEPVVMPGAKHHLSRAAWAFLLEVQPLLQSMDFNSDAWFAWASYWWAVNQSQTMGCEDCLVTPDMTQALLRVPDPFEARPWPISEFMLRQHAETPEFAEFSLETEAGRRDLTCALMILAVNRPDTLRYIPEDLREAVLAPVPAPLGPLRYLRAEAPQAPTLLAEFCAGLGAPQPGLTRQAYAGILRHRGFDLDRMAFDTVTAEGHRIELARLPKPSEPPVDIQVIGPAKKASGLGQATRLSIAMLEGFARETGRTLNAVDYSLDNPAPEGFNAERDVSDYRLARVNLFHINAESLPLSVAYQPDVMQGAYNIGYFYWELDSPAACHHLAMDLLDEIWVSTDYGVSIYQPHTAKPVTNVGMSFEALPEIDAGQARTFLEAKAGIEKSAEGEGPFIFLTTFDSFSFVQRKNPLGVLSAFRKAFKGVADVRLVIKTQNRARVMDPVQMKVWDAVDAILKDDDRIVLIDETMKYTDLLKLKKGADAYISLHRSEGWGFGMIEAMNLGVPVLATAFSGNMDFCDADTCWLVDYELTRLKPDDYIFVTPGQTWAEPDIDHAARQMRAMKADPQELSRRAQAARRRVQTEFSEDAIGARYAARLREILAGRDGRERDRTEERARA